MLNLIYCGLPENSTRKTWLYKMGFCREEYFDLSWALFDTNKIDNYVIYYESIMASTRWLEQMKNENF